MLLRVAEVRKWIEETENEEADRVEKKKFSDENHLNVVARGF